LDEYFNSTIRRDTKEVTPFPARTEDQKDGNRAARYSTRRAA
jgi:hypothetical protein